MKKIDDKSCINCSGYIICKYRDFFNNAQQNFMQVHSDSKFFSDLFKLVGKYCDKYEFFPEK